MYAGGISFVYNGDRVPLYSYGPRLGLPIITFSLGAYWGNYYRGPVLCPAEPGHIAIFGARKSAGRAGPPMSHGRPPVTATRKAGQKSVGTPTSLKSMAIPPRPGTWSASPSTLLLPNTRRPRSMQPRTTHPPHGKRGLPQNSRTRSTTRTIRRILPERRRFSFVVSRPALRALDLRQAIAVRNPKYARAL